MPFVVVYDAAFEPPLAIGSTPVKFDKPRHADPIAKQPVLMAMPCAKVEVAVFDRLMNDVELPIARIEPGEVVPMPVLPLATNWPKTVLLPV